MNTAKTTGLAETAAAVLADAETKLRDLVGRAAARREYDLAVRMATVAKSVASLTITLGDRDRCEDQAAAPTEADDKTRGGSPVAARMLRPGQGRAGDGQRSSRVPKKGAYPKFYREGDHLVKVSWSKKERGEYQHKAPHRVIELLTSAIAKRAANGCLFTTEDVFPLKDPQNGGDVPSYQAYAALAWFRAAGLVRPHGRRGYTVKRDGCLSELMTTAWRNLSESSN